MIKKENGFLIRDARSDELDEASLVIRDAYIEYKDYFPPARWKSYIENAMDVRSRLGFSELIIAKLNGNIVGSVTLFLDASCSPEEGWPQEWASIRLLAVHPVYRGQGIGRALIEECIQRCRERGIRTIGLHTAVIMGIARKMYEDIGFTRALVYDFYPRPDAVIMAYCLQL